MIDVHPPHHAANSWRDFFIHIATICVGLLIAIGLEQTVELVHRTQERRALITDLREECGRNLRVIDRDLAVYKATREQALVLIKTLSEAKAQDGFVTVRLPPRAPLENVQAPSRAVWSVAKSSGRVALLPENLAEIYDRVDHQGEEFTLRNRELNSAGIQVQEFATRLGVELTPGAELHLSVGDRDDLVRRYSHNLGERNMCSLWLSYWAGASQAVLDGVQSRDQIDRYLHVR